MRLYKITARKVRASATGGIWYWFPTPEGWDIQAFTQHGPLSGTEPGDLTDPSANVFHVSEFEGVIQTIARVWGISHLNLGSDWYQALPRGRVSQNYDRSWTLEHGGEFSTREIKKMFGLSSEQKITEEITQHHKTDPRHMEVLEQTLLHYTQNDPRMKEAFDILKSRSSRAATTTKLSASTERSLRLTKDYTQVSVPNLCDRNS